MSLLAVSYLLLVVSVTCCLIANLLDFTNPNVRQSAVVLVVVAVVALMMATLTGAVYFAGRVA